MLGMLRQITGARQKVWFQLMASYLLAGALPVVLILGLAGTIGYMVVLRGSANLVTRQLDLMVQASAASVESMAGALAERAGNVVEPAEGERLAAILSRRFPGSRTVIRWRDRTGKVTTFSAPTGSKFQLPSWIQDRQFSGVVVENGNLSIRSVTLKAGQGFTVEVGFSLPLDENVARLMASATELEVRSPNQQRRMRQSEGPASVLERYGGPGPGGWMPVVGVGRNWRSGEFEDREVFLVKPDFGTTVRQLAAFGREKAIWVWAISFLAVLLVLVETGASVTATRITRRVIQSIDELSKAAHRVGAGSLHYRIPVRHTDQLGLLAETFNQMVSSLEELQTLTREKERQDQQILVARQVQQSLYPRKLPQLPGVQVAASWQPAQQVNGDLYDVVKLGDRCLGLLCADVSGKGVPAAILAAHLQAIVRGFFWAPAQDRATFSRPILSTLELVQRVNKEMCARTDATTYATLFWADYDIRTRTLHYTNAGHNPPIVIVPDGDVFTLGEGGLPVGLFPDTSYTQGEIRLPRGSLVLLYTDGVTEAAGAGGVEFGERRLVEVCREHAVRSPDQLLAAVLEAVRRWTGGGASRDDMTQLAIKVT